MKTDNEVLGKARCPQKNITLGPRLSMNSHFKEIKSVDQCASSASHSNETVGVGIYSLIPTESVH